MARFIYSMQNILSMKEKLERQEKNNYSQAVARLRREEDIYDELVLRGMQSEMELKDVLSENISVTTIKEKEDALEIIKMYIKQQEFVVREKEEEVARAREVLNEAMKERKIYEKLKEKAFEEFILEENRKEQKEVDELVSYRYSKARSEE